ncbi:MAG: GcrA cell cycle regulator [Acetobacteraceae bacterium]|nr:GcrA cell cycle regulator [Acetobacteraceae bacterium]
MEWNEETIARIRALWAEGLSTAEIGRRMGISKNAVVGKAHRLNLPARPSPIRRVSSEKPARRSAPKRIVGPTLPTLDSVARQPVPTPPRQPVVLRPVPPQPRPAGRVSSCCWPLGEPGTPEFRFCGDPTVPAKPYCEEHVALAYVKVRDRREDAA